MEKKAKEKKASKPPRRVAVGAFRDAGPGLKVLAARAAAGKCPLCGLRPGTTQLAAGPVFVKVCDPCSQPLWHVMGLIDWFRKR